MIVPSMNLQEISKEVLEDARTFGNKLTACGRDFKKIVLHRSHYPVTKTYECKSLKRKNLFVFIFKAFKRSHFNTPFVLAYTVYSRPEGRYAVVPEIKNNRATVYPPHFFKRYRERILKEESLSIEGVIHEYFKNDWGSLGRLVNKDFEAIYYVFEKDNESNKLSFVGINAQGYFFGEKQSHVDIIKTIVPEDMLFKSQLSTFARLKADFIQQNKEAYGVSML
ncbi:MAG: hypothetical protein ABIP95_08365 [Pelobium sp.]